MVSEYIARDIEENLENVSNVLVSIISGNEEYAMLSNELTRLQAHLSAHELITELKTNFQLHELISATFTYSIAANSQRDYFFADLEYNQKQNIRQYIENAVENDLVNYNMGWQYESFNGVPYIFRFVGWRGNYVAIMVAVDNLISSDKWDTENESIPLLSTSDNLPITEIDFIEKNNINLSNDSSAFYFSGSPTSYMITGNNINNTELKLMILTNSGFFASLDSIHVLLFVLSLLAVLIIPLIALRFWDIYIKPIEQMTDTMDKIRAGDIEIKAEVDSNIHEFTQMAHTFNSMMSQMNNLKIEAYENDLKKEKAKFRYLQLQIRPHFFLNILKSLYALSQTKQEEKLKKMILAFSHHIRYIFTDNLGFVLLFRELKHITNYIEIQGISAEKPPICKINVDKRLEKLSIPPLSVQTFVENSIKHATTDEKALEIEINISLLESDGEQYADITVCDNGPGFSEEALAALGIIDSNLYKDEHIGIFNVINRLKLIYGEGLICAFYNGEFGAISELIIPIKANHIETDEEE